MGTDEVGGVSSSADIIIHHGESDIELIGSERVPHTHNLNKRRSGKLNASESTSGIDLGKSHQEQDEAGGGGEDYVEVTMDIHGDSVAVHSVKAVTGEEEDEKLGLLGKGIEKKRSFGASVVRSASIRMKQVSQELKRFASLSTQTTVPAPKRVVYDRTKSAASYALRGFKFIVKTDGGGAGWDKVEKQFEILTASTDGFLHRSLFAKCIGTLQNTTKIHPSPNMFLLKISFW